MDENKLDLGRNGCHTLGSLGSRSNVVVRQAGLQASRQVCKLAGRQTIFLQFEIFLILFANLNSEAHLSCLNGFIVLIRSFVPMDICMYDQYLKKMQLHHCFSEVGSLMILVDPYY